MLKKISYILLLFVQVSFANVTLPALFSDHMVLQQNDDVKFWGWANPNEEVVIKASWSEIAYKIKANNQAYWEIKIKTPSAGGPYIIKINGYNEIILKDVLIGEVWLCSGQSNMEMSAAWGIKNGDKEVEKANHPTIRFFTVSKSSATSPQNDLYGNWEVCSPETMKNSSAVAYYFAQRLQEDLKDVPLGLMVSAWGGTPAEIWMPEEVIEEDNVLKEAASKLQPVEWGPTEPARAFNSMINPLIGYNIAGTLWYQGEANVGASKYDKTLEALIKSWRAKGENDFPFYYVQIAPFDYGKDHSGGVEIRDAQRKVLDKVSNVGMVVISDVSPTDDIHPKDKKPVGIRLANLALADHYKTYFKEVNGPLYKGISIKNKNVIVHFDNAEGLYFTNKKTSLFEIAGKDKIYHTAKVRLKKNEITIFSKEVKSPKYVRFSWGNTSVSNLFNKVNLPASSFTTE
ncbi:sialate O-acetylesterase [Lutibacter flavus]|uniref:Sialate O-acetylesterase n=1 Tax=Lutibacter flavus TaxID=691689 RepID=A0A238VCF5_9FLAO|nr:sialate O-acetylesterase [Lutibacter flavus]SNR31199.1 sialate O-acetylesterase [Lutibacter flavus]